MHATDGMSATPASGSSTPRTGQTLESLAEMSMDSGRKNEPLQENVAAIAPEHMTFAKWLLSSEICLEVMLVSSDLPTVATTDNEAELESGVWFLCRADVPPLGESITRFVRKV